MIIIRIFYVRALTGVIARFGHGLYPSPSSTSVESAKPLTWPLAGCMYIAVAFYLVERRH